MRCHMYFACTCEQQPPDFDFDGMLALVDAADLHEHDPLHGMMSVGLLISNNNKPEPPPYVSLLGCRLSFFTLLSMGST
jgi:hypothetical protein